MGILVAQDCGCTTQQVLNNTVESCKLVVGEIVNVSTPTELQSAFNQANSTGGNMTILIADGTYPVISVANYPFITASNVVIRSESGNRDDVILVGTGMIDVSPGTENGIFAVGNNITIADLTIKEIGNHGIAASGEYLYVHNVKIQDTYEQMVKGVSADGGADFGVFQCSLLEYTNGVGPQWYIGGLDIHDGQDWIVRDNVFRNIASPSQQTGEHAVHFWNNSSDAIVERNLIFNCDRGIGFGLGSSASEGGIIRNNMIYNDGTGIFNDVGIGLETCPNTKVYNNTIHIEYQNAIEYRFEATTNISITNNLCNQPITSRNGGSATLTTNFENATSTWFEDIATGNLHLNEPIGEIVDQGTYLGEELILDFDQNIRPADAIDIGAHEFSPFISSTNETTEIDFQIFPNPTFSTIHIHTRSKESASILIYNSRGSIVIETNAIPFLKIDCAEWKGGVYFCVIKDVNGVVIGKNKVIVL